MSSAGETEEGRWQTGQDKGGEKDGGKNEKEAQRRQTKKMNL